MKMNMSKSLMLLVLLFAPFALPMQPAALAAGQILGGSLDAPIKIEVFSDFECPSCRGLYLDVMRRVVVDYSGQNRVCLIYHEFPLVRVHRYSQEAARYAEAAAQLGRDKLLKVYDILFMDQAQWSQDGKLEASIAKVLSRAEIQRLKLILRDPGINAAIQKEIKLGEQKLITSTPTFFISAKGNEQRVQGQITYIALKQFIDSKLQ
jgi:protein-disulfide isomerase